MRHIVCAAKPAILACLLVFGIQPAQSCAEDGKLTPVELVARHLQSIGNRDLLAKTKSRAMSGTSSVRFVQGANGESRGQGQLASERAKFGILLKYEERNYPGEHFAFDGKDKIIGRFMPGKMSPLADFINRFSDLMKEGLLGGALSVNWFLLDVQKTQPRLKYNRAKLKGQQVHALEYSDAKRGLGDLKIVLFFDLETYRHIRSEYRLHLSASFATGGTDMGNDTPDSYYVLTEDFADFKEIDGLTLPQRYTICFSSEGHTRTFLAYWTLDVQECIHNQQIDPVIFTAFNLATESQR